MNSPYYTLLINHHLWVSVLGWGRSNWPRIDGWDAWKRFSALAFGKGETKTCSDGLAIPHLKHLLIEAQFQQHLGESAGFWVFGRGKKHQMVKSCQICNPGGKKNHWFGHVWPSFWSSSLGKSRVVNSAFRRSGFPSSKSFAPDL